MKTHLLMPRRFLSGIFGILALVLLGMVSAEYLKEQRAEAQSSKQLPAEPVALRESP